MMGFATLYPSYELRVSVKTAMNEQAVKTA